MVTVAQLKELNSKIDFLKDKNATALAELKVLKSQFETKTQKVGQQLNVAITVDNIESLCEQAQQQLTEKAAKIESLLADLEGQSKGQAPISQQPYVMQQQAQIQQAPLMPPNGQQVAQQAMQQFGVSQPQILNQNPFASTQQVQQAMQAQQMMQQTPQQQTAGDEFDFSDVPSMPTFANFAEGTRFQI